MKRKTTGRIGKLCIITDTLIQDKYSHIEIAKIAIHGGADIIQFRDKYMASGEMINTALQIRNLCLKHSVIFIVNDRADIAMISNADGVHLGKEDIPIREARKLLGKNKIIGATAHSLNEAIKAEKEGADYIGYGHIFATTTKLKTTKPKGLLKLAEVCRKVKIPVIAIGGIDLDNASSVINSGAHGIAVIGSVLKNDNPANTVEKLRKIVYA